MSLINQMLRDLEQRNQQTPSVNQTQPLDIQMPRVETRPDKHYGWWLTGLLPIAVAGWFFWQSSQSNQPAIASSQPIVTTPSIKPAEPQQTQVIASAPEATVQPQSVAIEVASPAEQPAVQTDIPKPEAQTNSQTQQAETAKPELAAIEPAKVENKPLSISPQKTAKSKSITRPQQQADKIFRQTHAQMSRLMRQENLKEVLQLDPRHLAARQQLLQILIQEHSNLELKQFLDESLAWFPDNLGFITTLAHYHVQHKNFADAVATLERVDNFRINDPHYLALLAASYQQQHQFTQALPVYQKLTQIQPEKAENWLGLGICADKLQQNSSALDAYQQALNKNTLNSAVVDYINQRLSALTR
jgi:Flp pilus assembly protein TadD